MCKRQQIISSTRNTPEVILDPKGIIKISGRLIPENAESFFNPIDEWIKEYFYDPADITRVEIYLEYINSAGTKYLHNAIHEITHIHLRKNEKKYIINWYYKDDDEDMLDKGKFLSSILDISINFIRII